MITEQSLYYSCAGTTRKLGTTGYSVLEQVTDVPRMFQRLGTENVAVCHAGSRASIGYYKYNLLFIEQVTNVPQFLGYTLPKLVFVCIGCPCLERHKSSQFSLPPLQNRGTLVTCSIIDP